MSAPRALLCLFLWLLASAPVMAAPSAAAARPATPACRAFDGLAGGAGDAAPALTACLASVPPGSDVALAPGRYVLRSRVVIRQPVTLHSAGLPPSAKGCQPGSDPRCATLILVPAPADRGLPFAILANGVRIDALVFKGAGAIASRAALEACAMPERKPAGGGLQVQGDDMTITRSVFASFACYTALEFEGGSGTKIVGNVFAGNGAHDGSLNWADGLTIHDGKRLVVSGNRFIDNTDVQLIFGGCQDCTVSRNVFRHGGTAAGGSFAELMLHAWPKGATSGDFTGSHVTANDIDCSAGRRCGFGLMIGATPWYQAVTFGGTVDRNRIANAMVGLNVNDLTGPMQIRNNRVATSGGRYIATCGIRTTAAVNVSPASRRYVDPAAMAAAVGHGSFVGCLLNHPLAR